MQASIEFAGLASDSREVKPGYLFAALPGSKANGAAFVKDAVARGAIAVLGRPDVKPEADAQGVRFIAADNPRLALARHAAAFFKKQPKIVAAVTGTKGKSSIVAFVREIWIALGKPAASLGTVGVVTTKGEIPLKHTTPDPVEIHRLLAQLNPNTPLAQRISNQANMDVEKTAIVKYWRGVCRGA
jgi:UDP-N-acetylmuramoyl-L-alanyl-D-glutamate--2,6-diaminopimelate ligase